MTFLVESGADVNIQNNGGQTAMHMAKSYGYDSIVDFLTENNADLTIRNNDGHEAAKGIDGDK